MIDSMHKDFVRVAHGEYLQQFQDTINTQDASVMRSYTLLWLYRPHPNAKGKDEIHEFFTS
jgi:ketosteroid isomerase-like protein